MAHTWDADDYATNAGFVPELTGEILDWLTALPGERILDLGCGDGVLTARLVEAGALVVGVDTSESVLDELETLLAPALRDASGNWTADYVRLRVSAVRTDC